MAGSDEVRCDTRSLALRPSRAKIIRELRSRRGANIHEDNPILLLKIN